MTLLIGLLSLGGLLTYGVIRSRGAAFMASTSSPAPPPASTGLAAVHAEPAHAEAPPAAAPEARPAAPPEAPPAAPHQKGVANDAKPPAAGAPGAPPADSKATAIVKMEPLTTNLDEGDQSRILHVAVVLEVAVDAQPRVQSALPRARHESLLYLSSLHLADTQGIIGKQRIHRELLRRITDSVGGGLKRIYFDEFFVQ